MIIQEKAEEFLSQLKAKYEGHQYKAILYAFFDDANQITRISEYPHESDSSCKYALAFFPYTYNWTSDSGRKYTDYDFDFIVIYNNGDLEKHIEIDDWKIYFEGSHGYNWEKYFAMRNKREEYSLSKVFDRNHIEDAFGAIWSLAGEIITNEANGQLSSFIKTYNDNEPYKGIIASRNIEDKKPAIEKETEDGQRNLLWHYTSAATLAYLYDWEKSIDENSKLTFSATFYATLNDSSEYESVQKFHPCKVKEDFEEKYGYPFVLSLTESQDNILSWSMYGDNAKGIALAFDVNKLIEKLDLCTCIDCEDCDEKRSYLLECSYDDEETQYLPTGDFESFAKNCIAKKRKFFEQENEWRIVKFSHEYSFRATNNGLIPCLTIEIPITCLTKIVLGKNVSELTKKAVKAWADRFNKNIANLNIEVASSDAPLQK